MVFLYIIYSERLNFYFKGSTTNVVRRFQEHNNGRNKSTANKGPWKLLFVRSYEKLTDAQKEERRLKRTNTPYLEWHISQPFNEVDKFIAALSRLD